MHYVLYMIDVAHLANDLLQELEARRAAAAAADAIWIDELEQRRRHLAAETARLLACASARRTAR